jgi:hypothetical protein
MCDCFEAIVTCKRCTHPARVYRNPNVKVRKSSKDAPAIIVKDTTPSPEFQWWVGVICTNCNKRATLTYDDFKSITPPCCCNQKMKPKKYERRAYIYECEKCGKKIPLANLLPDSTDSKKCL